MGHMIALEEVGTGHVSSKNAGVAPLTLYCFCCFFCFVFNPQRMRRGL